MATEAPTKASAAPKETWRDWLPVGVPESPVLLTREQFIGRLQGMGVAIDDGTLRFWEQEGILPRPVRRWDPTARAARPFYPLWMIAPVFAVRELQRVGLPLRDIAPRLREVAQEAARDLYYGIEFNRPVSEEDDDLVGGLMAQAVLGPVFEAVVVPTIEAYARLRDRLQAKETLSVDFVFTDTDGVTGSAGFLVRDENGRYRERKRRPPAGTAS